VGIDVYSSSTVEQTGVAKNKKKIKLLLGRLT